MASTESSVSRSLADLLRDLGPREGERKVYKRVKEVYEHATRLIAGEPPDEWRPPGKGYWEAQLKGLAAKSLHTVLELRQNRPIQKPP